MIERIRLKQNFTLLSFIINVNPLGIEDVLTFYNVRNQTRSKIEEFNHLHLSKLISLMG